MTVPPPDYAAARAEVLAALAAGGPPPPEPVTAQAPGVLRPVPAQLSAKLASRVRAGLSPTGSEPSRPRLAKLVRPSAGLVVLDAIVLGVCVAQGRTALAVGAALLLALFAGVAVVGVVLTARDPLRVSAADRSQLAAAATWQSSAAGPIDSPAHRLVAAAATAAERVASSQAWLDTRIDLLPVDLCAVLDSVAAAWAASADGEPAQTAVELVVRLVAFADLLEAPLDPAARERLDVLADQLREHTAQTAHTARRFGEP
ncbi:hypothetical protein [uncultured Jatrophihabitans sp.]|uniref:hypothetical protein n=1 Tax=uncultured Jatrophihabitans sp. TaxID=1610747 RepID=UPI0035CB0AAD